MNRKLLWFLLFCIICLQGRAQQFEVTVSQLCFNNCPNEIHMIAWIDTVTTSGQQQVIKGTVSGNDGIGNMNAYNHNSIYYRYTFNPVEYFDSISSNIQSIGFTFRDACGSSSSSPCMPDTVIIDLANFTQDSLVFGEFKIKKINRPLFKLTYTGFSFGNNSYFHSGIELNQNGNLWTNQVGNWGDDDGVGQMCEDGITGNKYIYLDLPTYFNQDNSLGSAFAETETVSKIYFRIRNENGIPYFNDTASVDFSECPPKIYGNNLQFEMIPAFENGLSPVASITSNIQQILAGGSVLFSDNCSGNPDKWLWKFYDGNPSTSVSQNPASISFANAGCKPVSLTVYNKSGCSSMIDSCYISVRNNPGQMAVDFRTDNLQIQPGDHVDFFDMSTDNPTSWNWEFPGSTTITDNSKNPVNIIYNQLGCYPVKLKASNATLVDSLTKTCFITVDYCQPTFELSGQGGNDHIDFFRMGNLNYSSPNLCNFCYHHETNDTLTLISGFPYDMDMFFTTDNPSGFKFNLFLDSNQDGIFDPTEQLLPFNFNNSFSSGFVKTVTPSGNPGITRLRLVMNTPFGSMSGCPVIRNAGEVIDFTVNMLDTPYCAPMENYDPGLADKTYIDGVQLDNIQNLGTGLCGNPNGSIGPLAPHYTAYPMSTSLTQGNSYSITITPGGNDFLAKIGAWIDFNMDGDFNDPNEIIAAISFDTIANPFIPLTMNFTVPFSGLGTTVMRIRSFSNSMGGNQIESCENVNFSETEDYSVEILNGTPCLGLPNPGNTLASVDSACSGVQFLISLQNSTGGTGVSYIWQVDSGLGWQTLAGVNDPSFLTSQNGGTSYQCTVSCAGGGSTTSNPVFVPQNAFYNCYCSSTSASPDFEEIIFVGISTINNISNCSTTGGAGSLLNSYSDYTAMVEPGVLDLDSTYSFLLMIDECNGTGNGFSAIYIDFNHNSVFDEPDEKVFTSFSFTTGPHSEMGSFEIPATALKGLTRMRVITGPFIVNGPCGVQSSGETEDYLVNIGEPPVSDFTASTNVVSIGNPVTFTDASLNNPTTWLWTFQGGNPSSSNLQIPPTVSWLATGCYDVILETSNEFGISIKDSVCMMTVNTGLEEYNNSLPVKIYPNPASKDLTILTDESISKKDIHFYNVFGQLINIPLISGKTKQFVYDVSDLSNGIYWMSVSSKDGVSSRKFIVRK